MLEYREGDSTIRGDQDVNQFVAQVVDEVRFPVIEASRRKHWLDDPLNVDIFTRLDIVQEWGSEFAQRLEQGLPFSDRPVEHRPEAEPWLPIGAGR